MRLYDMYNELMKHIIFTYPIMKDGKIDCIVDDFERAVTIYPTKKHICLEASFDYCYKDDCWYTGKRFKAKTYKGAIKKLYKYVLEKYGQINTMDYIEFEEMKYEKVKGGYILIDSGIRYKEEYLTTINSLREIPVKCGV